MPEISRRRFVGSTVGAPGRHRSRQRPAGGAHQAVADASDKPGSLSRIEHVIVFMQESRSFDTYFGNLRGVRGFDDPTAVTLPSARKVGYQPDAKNPDGQTLPTLEPAADRTPRSRPFALVRGDPPRTRAARSSGPGTYVADVIVRRECPGAPWRHMGCE